MSEPEAQGFTGGAVDAYDSGGRPLCPHEKLAHHIEVVIVGIGTVKLCDACRRLLATCERCSAFEALTCKTAPPRRTWFYNDQQWGEAQPTVDESDWCRDGFRQARPWTLEEARRWLGLCKHCGAELPEGADDGDCKTCAREGMLTEEQRAELTHPPDPFGGLLDPDFKADVPDVVHGDTDSDGDGPTCPECEERLDYICHGCQRTWAGDMGRPS